MRRFGLPVTAITLAIMITSLISGLGAINNDLVSAKINKSYVSAAESTKTKYSKTYDTASVNDIVSVISPQSIQTVDGVTVTSRIDQSHFKISEENIFIFTLFAVSLFFMATGIRRTIRGFTPTKRD